MSKRVSSSDWTGPINLAPRSGAFTYMAGQHSTSSDYQRMLAAENDALIRSAETKLTKRLAALLLVSPILLWLSAVFVRSMTDDLLINAPSDRLIIWGVAAFAWGAIELVSRSTKVVVLRNALLVAAIGGTTATALAYGRAGFFTHEHAIAAAPERTFQSYQCRGRRSCTKIYFHQRANGSYVEGHDRSHPSEFAAVCALVQRLDGPNGFSWVRVLERSRSPETGQLSWPVRREECFSETPLSELPR